MVGATLDRIDALFDRRFASRPGWVVLAELFLVAGWLRAAVAKFVDADWWAGRTIVAFVEDHSSDTMGWYRPIVDHLILGYSGAWAVVVILLEVAISLALLTALRVRFALVAAIFLNVNFVLVGAPNPSVFYLILQLGLLLWLLETSPAKTDSMRWLRLLTVGGIALTLGCLPYVRTVSPDAVIDDPASVLATWTCCAAVATFVARRRVRREKLKQAVIDLTGLSAVDVERPV